MVCGVRVLSVNEAPSGRSPDRSAGRTGWLGDGADEVNAVCARTLFGLGVARARALDYPWHFDWPHLNCAHKQHTTCNGENRPGKRLMTATHRFTLAFLLILSTFAFAADQPFDLVITSGHIVDGTGSPWYSGDIGIRDGRIAAIGNLSAAARKRTVDAKGKVVAPGFIDMLGQSETTILVDPRLPSKIYQGITTEITGEGGSAAPLNDAIIAADF